MARLSFRYFALRAGGSGLTDETIGAVVPVVVVLFPVLVFVIRCVIRVVVRGVAVAQVRIRGLPVGTTLVRVDAQLSPQPVKVGPAAAVLQLAGHLDLLGLGSAAPHWLDPL